MNPPTANAVNKKKTISGKDQQADMATTNLTVERDHFGCRQGL
jgi:hypothetical protein